jgi:hypothetical protein
MDVFCRVGEEIRAHCALTRSGGNVDHTPRINSQRKNVNPISSEMDILNQRLQPQITRIYTDKTDPLKPNPKSLPLICAGYTKSQTKCVVLSCRNDCECYKKP